VLLPRPSRTASCRGSLLAAGRRYARRAHLARAGACAGRIAGSDTESMTETAIDVRLREVTDADVPVFFEHWQDEGAHWMAVVAELESFAAARGKHIGELVLELSQPAAARAPE